FTASPGGYPGNDDLGQMSAWYVFGALGLYPAVPATDVLALASPLFPKVTLHLARGDVVIQAPTASRAAPYGRGLTVNGGRYGKPWLTLRDLAGGARLTYDLSSTPSPTWGSNPSDAPPSFGPTDPTGCAAVPRAFTGVRKPVGHHRRRRAAHHRRRPSGRSAKTSGKRKPA